MILSGYNPIEYTANKRQILTFQLIHSMIRGGAQAFDDARTNYCIRMSVVRLGCRRSAFVCNSR